MPLRPERLNSEDRGGRHAGRALRVLVVDDDPDICQILGDALGIVGGYDVSLASDAKQALLAIEQEEEPFDGIFLDIQMPGTTGIELCPIIRRTPGYADVPIIMLTAMTERCYLQSAFANGANDYITKPFDFDDIRTRFARERLRQRRRRPLKGEASGGGRGGGPRTKEVIRALEDAVAIEGVDRCVTKEAFENFLLQSSARYSTPLSVRAIKVAQVYDLFSKLPDGEYQKIIHGIATVISDKTVRSSDVFTYAGNGIFLCACLRKSALDLDALSESLQKSESFNRLVDHDLTLHVILGREISLEGMSKAEVLFSLNRAIESAEGAENTHFGWRSYREWLSQRKSVGREKARVEKAAYEQILNDFIGTGGLGWK